MTCTLNRQRCGLLLDDWQKEFRGESDRLQELRAAIAFMVRGRRVDSLVEISRITLVVLQLHEEEFRQAIPRLSGYRCHRIPWGVQWGGAAGHRFEKDPRLAPRHGARGPRVDLNDNGFMRTALRLKKLLCHEHRHDSFNLSQSLRLPRLWAGFEPEFAATVRGEGPELLGACHTTGECAATLMQRSRRHFHGLVLYPLDWVSHVADEATEVFADMGRCPRYQVLALTASESPLQGFRGACAFDLIANRFAPSPA